MPFFFLIEVKKKKKEKREHIQWLNKQREPLGLERDVANPFTTNSQTLPEARSSAGRHMPGPRSTGEPKP